MLNQTLKTYCNDNKLLVPQFRLNTDVNKEIMMVLDKADHEKMARGDDLHVDMPDGFIKFSNVEEKIIDVCLGINDWRIPQYHLNNGVTKIGIKR